MAQTASSSPAGGDERVAAPPPGPSAGSPALLLFPTALEERRFRDLGGLPTGHALTAVIGFGPIAAAARTAELLTRLRPRRSILVGIAGSYDPAAYPVGAARTFAEVAVDGVGVGEGARFRGPAAVGFPQWPAAAGEPAIEDRLPLVPLAGAPVAPLLLTTCAASDSPAQAAERRARFPAAAGEDMEAFGVALACRLARTPLTVVRGFSNVVGDRERANWRLPLALTSARELLLAGLACEPGAPEPAPAPGDRAR